MKRIFSLIFLIVLAVNANAQSGTGIITDPYYGDISTSPVWSLSTYPGNTVYVGTVANPDLKIINGGHLTINPGITVIFTQLTSDLLITGSGQLTALGTSSLKIKFTKALANGHWGHISFETPGTGDPISGTGSFDYCIIEYGYAATSGTTPDNAGGGLQINASGVVVDHCLFENNYSNFGGAVTVNAGINAIIRNSIFKTNLANEAGGALLLWTSSTARVENCIFEQNHSNGVSYNLYSGGAIWSLQNSSIIVNCTFVKNTSNHAGDAIYSYASAGMQIINCILWGSSTQFAGDYTTTTIVNCAFETAKPANAINSIIISNIGSDHFVNAGASDWTLKFISPCRDAGTTPSPTVPNDYIGNVRIGPYDIGAYEVQYSRWKTTPSDNTSWTNTGNWEQNLNPAAAGSTGDVIIPAGSSSFPNISSVSIGTGKYLIIDPKAQATFGTLDNSSTGTLWLKSDSHGINDSIASLKVGTYTPGGTEKIELYLQGNSSMWHYISPPVASIATSVFYYSGSGAAVTEYRENLIDNDMNNGWVTSTGYHLNPSTLLWASGSPTWSKLLVGRGYNYFGNSSKTFTLQGAINTGDVSVNLVYNSGTFTPANTVERGYNLIGNPYTCGLNWNAVMADVSNTGQTGWSEVEQAIYFRKNGVSYYYVGGATLPGDLAGNPIAPMQGFFIHTKTNFNLTIPASSKVHTLNPRFKGDVVIPMVRLQLQNSGKTDETLLRFDDKATLSFDNSFDARKFLSESGVLSISSSLGETEYAINGIPFPETSVSIPLIINASSTSSYTIAATEILGIDNYKVYLNDKVQNLTVNLSDIKSYSFDATKGLSTDRFVITISKILTALPENTVSDKPFNIYSSGEQINIQTLSDNWSGKPGEVYLLDLTGKTISQLRNIEFSKDEIKQLPANVTRGIYIVEIKSGVMRYVGKVVIR